MGSRQSSIVRKNCVLVGESAGGNLAEAVSIMARDQKLQLPVHQVLVYPIAAHDFNTGKRNAKPLNRVAMQWFTLTTFPIYRRRDPRISLVNAPDLKGLPATTLITAQIDPLRSEGKMFAQKLQQAGVNVDYKNYEGVTHEVFEMTAVLQEAKQAVTQAATNLKNSFKQVREAAGAKKQEVHSGNTSQNGWRSTAPRRPAEKNRTVTPAPHAPPFHNKEPP